MHNEFICPITFQESIELIKWRKKEVFARDAYVFAWDALLSYLLEAYASSQALVPRIEL